MVDMKNMAGLAAGVAFAASVQAEEAKPIEPAVNNESAKTEYRAPEARQEANPEKTITFSEAMAMTNEGNVPEEMKSAGVEPLSNLHVEKDNKGMSMSMDVMGNHMEVSSNFKEQSIDINLGDERGISVSGNGVSYSNTTHHNEVQEDYDGYRYTAETEKKNYMADGYTEETILHGEDGSKKTEEVAYSQGENAGLTKTTTTLTNANGRVIDKTVEYDDPDNLMPEKKEITRSDFEKDKKAHMEEYTAAFNQTFKDQTTQAAEAVELAKKAENMNISVENPKIHQEAPAPEQAPIQKAQETPDIAQTPISPAPTPAPEQAPIQKAQETPDIAQTPISPAPTPAPEQAPIQKAQETPDIAQTPISPAPTPAPEQAPNVADMPTPLNFSNESIVQQADSTRVSTPMDIEPVKMANNGNKPTSEQIEKMLVLSGRKADKTTPKAPTEGQSNTMDMSTFLAITGKERD